MEDATLNRIEKWHETHVGVCPCEDCIGAVGPLVAEVRRQRELLRAWQRVPFRNTLREQHDAVAALQAIIEVLNERDATPEQWAEFRACSTAEGWFSRQQAQSDFGPPPVAEGA